MIVLITSGPTQERIDGVRSITNFSTGTTGAQIADHFSEHGAKVYFIHNPHSTIPKRPVEKRLTFFSFAELNEVLKDVLNNNKFDAVIHLAAVGDYSVEYIVVNGKKFKAADLDKVDSGEDMDLRLIRNPKIIDSIKSYHPHGDLLLFGFKLTNSDSTALQFKGIDKIIKKPDVDYVVHNDLKNIGKDEHIAHIYSKSGQVCQTTTKKQLAMELFKICKKEKLDDFMS